MRCRYSAHLRGMMSIVHMAVETGWKLESWGSAISAISAARDSCYGHCWPLARHLYICCKIQVTCVETRLCTAWALTRSSYNSSVFEVSAAQDFDVTLGSSIEEISKEMSTWKSLDNEEWQRIYATSTVPGYSDLHLLIDQVSYGMRMHQNWSYTLESPANMSCDWPAISYDDLNFDVRMHHDQKSSTLSPMEIQPFRFFRPLVYLPDTNQSPPDSPWPGPRSIQAGEAVGVQGVLDACPKNGWLGPSTAFHVKEARAKVNSYANRVQIAIPFLSIVIIANFIKVIAIYSTIRMQSSGHLITAGDAIASFLEHPEPATRGMCTLTKSQLCSPGSEKEAKPWQVVKEPMAVVLGGSRMWSGIIMYVSRVYALPYRLYPSKKKNTQPLFPLTRPVSAPSRSAWPP
jgi:hypothetical protein